MHTAVQRPLSFLWLTSSLHSTPYPVHTAVQRPLSLAYYPIRNLSNGQRCESLEFIGRPTIAIEGHPRLSIYFQSFPIQEVPLSRYWPVVGYANDFRHCITVISSPNHWFNTVVIYILSRHWPVMATRRPMPAQYLAIFGRKWMTMHDRIPGLHLSF